MSASLSVSGRVPLVLVRNLWIMQLPAGKCRFSEPKTFCGNRAGLVKLSLGRVLTARTDHVRIAQGSGPSPGMWKNLGQVPDLSHSEQRLTCISYLSGECTHCWGGGLLSARLGTCEMVSSQFGTEFFFFLNIKVFCGMGKPFPAQQFTGCPVHGTFCPETVSDSQQGICVKGKGSKTCNLSTYQ